MKWNRYLFKFITFACVVLSSKLMEMDNFRKSQYVRSQFYIDQLRKICCTIKNFWSSIGPQLKNTARGLCFSIVVVCDDEEQLILGLIMSRLCSCPIPSTMRMGIKKTYHLFYSRVIRFFRLCTLLMNQRVFNVRNPSVFPRDDTNCSSLSIMNILIVFWT